MRYRRGLMFTTRSILIGVVSAAVAAFGQTVHAGGNAIDGFVKGPDGRLLPGAEVRAERIDAKGPAVVTTTNAKGEYNFKGLNPGAYKVVAIINKTPKSQASIRTRETGSVRVDFDLTAKKTAGKMRMVWVAGETGTHIGGGHWEAVDDTNTGHGSSAMQRVDGQVLTTPGNGLNPAGGASGPGH